MGITALWPLAFLLLVPLIILLYILRQEAKPHPFSSVMLWQEAYRNLEATRPWEKLKRNILLFLQLLAILLLILAMMGPWIASWGKEGEQVILVVDNSASMDTRYDAGAQATAANNAAANTSDKAENLQGDSGGETTALPGHDNLPTRLEAARDAACAYVDSLSPNASVHVISVNQQAALVVTNSSDHSEIKKRIQGIPQTSLAGDPYASLGLVRSCAGQSENAKIIFFTDSAFELGNLKASVESFYNKPANLSLDSLAYSTRGDRQEALALVTNHCDYAVAEEMNLYAILEDGQEKLLSIEGLSAGPGESITVITNLKSQDMTDVIGLRASLNEVDDLAGDNEAFCAINEGSSRRALLLTRSNLFIEKAFTNLAGMEVYRTSDVTLADGREKYDLYIFDGILPEKLPSTGSFLFIGCNPASEKGEWTSSLMEAQGSRYALIDSAVTTYISGKQIGANSSLLYQLPSWGYAFMETRMGAELHKSQPAANNGNASAAIQDKSLYTPAFYGTYDGHRMAALGFDLHQTDFALTAEFPVLIANLSDYLTTTSLTEVEQYVAGESIILYGSSRGGDLSLTLPDGSKREISAGDAYGSYFQAVHTGLHQVAQAIDGETRKQSFAVLFPGALESEVTPADAMTAEGKADQVTQRSGLLALRRYIILLAICLILLEWLIYLSQQPGSRRRFAFGKDPQSGRRKIVFLKPESGKRRGSGWKPEYVIRTLVLALLLAAFFEPAIRKSSKLTTTVFLVDASDSVSNAIPEEEEFVREAIADMPADNQAGIIIFGADSRIEQFVTQQKSFTRIQSTVTSSATDLQQAIQSALSLYPDDTAKRMVILTDGQENQGSIEDAVSLLVGQDIELKVVHYDSSVAEEVYVDGVTLPDTISIGDTFQVKVDIYATEATDARVTLYSGRTLKGQKEVILQKGRNQLVFADQGLEQGIRSYRVTVEADKDTVTVNNSYSAFTTIEAPPVLLLVEGNAGEAEAFEKVLQADNLQYEKVSPTGVPNSISDMLRYDAVILQNVYAPDLRSGFLDTLDTYVADYAGGLICIGGKDSYALGGYIGTPLERILPVSCTLEGEKEIPSIAMVMVIDHSGSMDSPSTQRGSVTCLDVAKNAALAALDGLREIDQVGVVSFDDSYDWAVPIQAVTKLDEVAKGIRSIPSGGGTSIYPAVHEAVKQLEKTDSAIKHIILLTDGQDGYTRYEPLYQEMNEQGITLSSVAIGTGCAESILRSMAESTGGRYYYSDAGTALPRIFAQEVFLSTKSYRINETFTPTIVNSHEILRDVFNGGSPKLDGYIASSMKPMAIEVLRTHREDPLLALWQYGLGHAVAWTSDASGEWSSAFSGWEGNLTLWRNITDWSISDTSLGEDTLQIEQKANSAVVTYETQEYDSETNITALITDENGTGKQVTLRPVSPGRYQASAELADTGVYSVSLRNKQRDEIRKSINTATAMQYSREYRFAEVSNQMERFLQQLNGRYISKADEVFDTKLQGAVKRTELTIPLLLAGLLLFAFDILYRRMLKNMKLGEVMLAGIRKRTQTTKSAQPIQSALGSQSMQLTEEIRKASGKDAGHFGTGISGPENQGTGSMGAGSLGLDSLNTNKQNKLGEKTNSQRTTGKTTPQAIDTAALLKKKKDRQ